MARVNSPARRLTFAIVEVLVDRTGVTARPVPGRNKNPAKGEVGMGTNHLDHDVLVLRVAL